MKRTEYSNIQLVIDRNGLNRTIEIAEGFSDVILTLVRGFQRAMGKAGAQMEEISPYLPRSQA